MNATVDNPKPAKITAEVMHAYVCDLLRSGSPVDQQVHSIAFFASGEDIAILTSIKDFLQWAISHETIIKKAVVSSREKQKR